MKSAILLLLLILPFVQAQQPPEGANWSRLYGDSFGSNFSPQNSITKDTVAPLDIKWIFPLFKNPSIADAIRVAEGVEHPPLVIDGIVYFVKGSEQIVALKAEDGRFIWGFGPPFTPKNRSIAT